MEYTALRNGVKMPMEGFGVFQVPEAAVCEQAVHSALAAGYRLIDTAAGYLNEKAVGAAIRKSGVPREEIFVTTKLWIQDYGYESTKKAFQNSLDNLGFGIYRPLPSPPACERLLQLLACIGRTVRSRKNPRHRRL